MSRFSCIVPSLIRQSYRDFESVQRMIGSRSCRIFSIVALIAASVSNPWAILYSVVSSDCSVNSACTASLRLFQYHCSL